MTAPTPTLFVPVDLAEELRALRAELAEVRAVVAPLAAQAGWQTVEDAAAAEGVSTATVNRWVRSGCYEARGSGRARRVRRVQP